MAGKAGDSGPIRNPSITGELSVVRGYFNFLGKRFNLTRGVVSFLGDVPLLRSSMSQQKQAQGR
jgi:autotransporter translocation and assembly factor TamB